MCIFFYWIYNKKYVLLCAHCLCYRFNFFFFCFPFCLLPLLHFELCLLTDFGNWTIKNCVFVESFPTFSSSLSSLCRGSDHVRGDGDIGLSYWESGTQKLWSLFFFFHFGEYLHMQHVDGYKWSNKIENTNKWSYSLCERVSEFDMSVATECDRIHRKTHSQHRTHAQCNYTHVYEMRTHLLMTLWQCWTIVHHVW